MTTMDMGRLQVESIGHLPEGSSASAVTSGGHVVAFSATVDDRLAFSWDGIQGAAFDLVGEMRDKSPTIFVSGDGGHVAYMAVRDGRFFVGRDGAEDPSAVDISRSTPPTFDHSGSHLAYGAKFTENGATQLVLDGVARVGTLAPIRPVFSPDGSRLAFVELRGSTNADFEARIVLDDVPGAWFRGMRNASGALQFSPDGKRFAYYSRLEGSGARWTVDGVSQRVFHDNGPFGLAQLLGIGVLDPPLPATFSPDGRRFAYWADVVERGVAIIEDDVPGETLKSATRPIFSADSRHLAYCGETLDERVVLIVDGVRVGDWKAKSMGEPTFSPDGRRVALSLGFEEGRFLRKRKSYAMTIDGQIVQQAEATEMTRAPIWSADGSHLAWWLQQGDRTLLVTDGLVRQEWPSPGTDFLYDTANRLVYGAGLPDGNTIMVDDRPGRTADLIVPLSTALYAFDYGRAGLPPLPFRLSPDGKHVAWAGMFEGRVQPVLDDTIGPDFDDITDCQFRADGSVTWWARRGTELLRATAPAG